MELVGIGRAVLVLTVGEPWKSWGYHPCVKVRRESRVGWPYWLIRVSWKKKWIGKEAVSVEKPERVRG